MSITTVGKALGAGLLCGSGSPTTPTYLAYGTGTNAFAAGNTSLQTESQRAAATVSLVTTTTTNDTAQWTKTFSITGTETVTEIGLLNAAASGTLFSRCTSTDAHFTQKSVVNGDSLAVTYKCKLS